MASPLSSTVASVPGPVLPCGVVLCGGSTVPGSSNLLCRPSALDPRVPTLPGPSVGQLVPPGLGLDPVSMQLARLSRYQHAAAAAACLITGTPGHQSSAGHLLSYLYARQQQQQRLQHDRCHPNPGNDRIFKNCCNQLSVFKAFSILALKTGSWLQQFLWFCWESTDLCTRKYFFPKNLGSKYHVLPPGFRGYLTPMTPRFPRPSYAELGWNGPSNSPRKTFRWENSYQLYGPVIRNVGYEKRMANLEHAHVFTILQRAS